MDGFIDPILINRLSREIQTLNTTTLHRDSGSHSLDRRRSIEDECGFPTTQSLTPERMREMYDRDALAARVVEVWPKECWKVTPEVYETNDNKITTPFEIAWDQLGASLVSEPGYYNEEKSSVLYEYMQRADIACGIGRYGCVLLGLNDGKDLSEPVQIVNSSSGSSNTDSTQVANAAPIKLTYLRVFDESLCMIVAREMDPKSPRWGQPTQYQVTFDNPDDQTGLGMVNPSLTSQVHWTRIVHIVDNGQTYSGNEIMGVYRIRPVLNDLMTAQKSRWGSGEVYWKNALQKISFETHPQLGGDVIYNPTKFKDNIEKAMNGLQQYWVLSGMSAKSIAPVSIDPKPYIDPCIQSICVKTEVPVPVFVGYEVGQLAGSMNVEDWNGRVKRRQTGHCTNRVICPLINRLINIGVLPVPTQGYMIDWPDISTLNAKDKAQVQSFRINIIVAYLKNNCQTLIPPVEFLVRFLDMTQDEANKLVELGKQELQKQKLIQSLNQPEPQPTQQQPNTRPNVQQPQPTPALAQPIPVQ